MARVKRLNRRDFMRLTAFAAGSALLAACQPAVAPPSGGAEETEAGTTPATGQEALELTWLVRSNPVENAWEEDVVIPAIQGLYPNVTINEVLTPDSDWNAKVMSMYAGGSPPDVHNGIVGTFIQLYAQDKVLELTPYVEADNVDLEPFGRLAKDPDMCRSGKQWGLPILSTYGCPLFYNMDLFDEAGVDYPPTDWQDKSWNFDRVLELAQALTKNYGTGDAVYGFIGGDQVHQWAYAWGGDCWQADWYTHGISEMAFEASEAVINGFEFKSDLINKYQVTPTPSDIAALNQLGNPFQTGRVAMSWEGGWGYWNYSDITAFKWGVAPSPWGTSNKCVNWTDCVIAPKASKSPDMSWALIKYLTSLEGQTAYAKATRTPPTRTDAVDPWLDFLTPRTGMTRDQLKQVGLGFQDHYQDNWAHYVISAKEFQLNETQERDVILSGEKTSAEHMPVIAEKQNATAKKVYEEFKDSRLMSDDLCQPLIS